MNFCYNHFLAESVVIEASSEAMECSVHRRTLLESSSTTGPIHNAVQSSESRTADDVTTWTRSLPVTVGELHRNHGSLAAKVQGVKTRNGFGPPSQSVAIEDSSTIDWPCSVSNPYIISLVFEKQKTFWGVFQRLSGEEGLPATSQITKNN